MNIIWKGSPNKTKGRRGYKPQAIVIHIMEGSLSGTDAWFGKSQSQVSAHYGVGKEGQVHQYVHDADAAWHAGRTYKPSWRGILKGVNPNLYTLGIEHEGFAKDTWPDPMLTASAALLRDLCARWSIPIDRNHIVGHREIYSRKTCPGFIVDLDALVDRARALAIEPPADTASGGRHNFVEDPGTVDVRVKLNVRSAPTSQGERHRAEQAGATLDVKGWTSNGESVSGNAHWYLLSDGRWAWAGGTRTPIPALDGLRCP